MDFGLTTEQAEMLRSIDGMMRRVFPPEMVRKFDQAHEYPAHLLPAFAELGLLGVAFPERYGGLNGDWRTVVLIQERLGYHAAIAASLYSITVDFGGMALMKYGTEDQRRRLLPDLIAGKLQFSLALTEPQAGTDAAALRSSATRSNDGWRINGRKTWISGADSSAYLVTACRTVKGSVGRDGISILLVPRDAPGIHMTQLPKVGNNSLLSWDIGFDDVQVGSDALMGVEGDGFRALMSTLMYSRSGQAANAVGQGQAVVDLALRHVKEREQFGAPLAQFQVLRHRLVDMQTRVDQARLTLYHLAWLIDQERRCRRESAQAKIVASEMLRDVAQAGMQILASAGYAAESDMNRFWRDSALYTFGEGTNEMLRDLVAREMGL